MKKILDACCGSRMFWFDRENQDVLFADNRELETTLCDGRALLVKPDIKMDFREMPFPDNTFKIVVFDPPHLKQAGSESWLAKKYGGSTERLETIPQSRISGMHESVRAGRNIGF